MNNKETRLSGELAVLRAIPGAAAIIDEQGEILEMNDTWKNGLKCTNWLGLDPESLNYIEHCRNAAELGNDYALKLLLGIRDVLENPGKVIQQTISAEKSAEKKWCKVSISNLENGDNCLLIVFDDVTANMNAIQALKESEERYSQHFKYSLSGIIIGTPDGNILDANPAACQMLGYTKDELIKGGRPLIVDVSDPAHLEMMRIRNETTLFEGEKEYTRKDGQKISVEITSVLHRNQYGDTQIINTFRDNSAEKKAELSLDEERRFTKTALDSIPGIFFVINAGNECIRWNNTIENELGYSADELHLMNILNLFHPEEKSNALENFGRIIEEGNGNFVARISAKDGSSRTYQLHFNRFDNEDEPFLTCTGVDITTLLEIEKEKSENYALMNQLFKNSPLATVLINPDGRVKNVNNGFSSLFGYSKHEVIGKNVNELITDEKLSEEAENISQKALRGVATQLETVRIDKNKNTIPVLINTVPIRNNGAIIAAYGIYVDLTNQKKLEKELQQSLNEKDVLLQEVHHRVKNNLAIIAGLLELQIMHLENEHETDQLKQVLSRVFSISSIHETLYQHEDVVRIRFDNYLDRIIESLPGRMNKHVAEIKKNPDSEPLMLNLNQAVPLGLIINELINLGVANENIGEKIAITLSSDNHTVKLEIDGINPQIDELKTGLKPDTFHKLLIKTFLDQIDARIKLEESTSNKLVIHFKKSDSMKGANSSIPDQYNLVNKKIIIEN